MRLFDVLIAFAALSLLLLLAIAVRERIGWLRRLALPEALIAGLLGLAIGPSGFVRPFPESVYEVWIQTPAVLISVVFASLFLGQSLSGPGRLWRRAASQTAFGMVLGFGQYLVGGLTVLLVLQPLLGVHPLMAALIEVGFEGGHGTAAGMGPTYAKLGFPAGEALGLAMATIGVLAAVLLGSSLVVIARTRSWLLRSGLQKEQPEQPPAAAPQELRTGATIPSLTIDAITVNLALIGGAVGLGVLIQFVLIQLAQMTGGEPLATLFAAVPVFPLAMLGGLLMQLLMQRQGKPHLASPILQARLGSLAMDVLITAAMASLDLALLKESLLPIGVLALVGLSWNVLVLLLVAPRIFQVAWFERAIVDFGQSTGVTSSGLLLLRMADPSGRSQAMESFSLKQLFYEPFLGGGLITAFAPIAISAWGLPHWTALSLAAVVAALIVGLALARR